MSISEEQVTVVVDALAASLKERRIGIGMSLSVLAEKTGLSRTAVRNIEERERTPTIASLLKIADALGIPCWELVRVAEALKKTPKKQEVLLSPQTEAALETLRIKCQKSPNLAAVVEGLVREM